MWVDTFFDKLQDNVAQYTFGTYSGLADAMTTPVTATVALYIVFLGIRLFLGHGDKDDLLRKGLIVSVVAAFALNWSYFSIAVDAVMEVPDKLVVHMIDGDTQSSMESKFEKLYNVTSEIVDKAVDEGGIISNPLLLLVAFFGYAMNCIFIIVIYFLLATSLITMSVLLVLAPFVIPFYFFENTKGFVMGWGRTIAASAIIPLLTFGMTGLFIHVLQELVDEIAINELPTMGQLFSYSMCTAVCIILMFSIPSVANSITNGFSPQSILGSLGRGAMNMLSLYSAMKGGGGGKSSGGSSDESSSGSGDGGGKNKNDESKAGAQSSKPTMSKMFSEGIKG